MFERLKRLCFRTQREVFLNLSFKCSNWWQNVIFIAGFMMLKRATQVNLTTSAMFRCKRWVQAWVSLICCSSAPQPQLEGSTGFMCWARGFMEIHSASSQEAVGESLQRYCSADGAPPLLVFPEEDTTNGRAGLLKFRSVWLSVVFTCVTVSSNRGQRESCRGTRIFTAFIGTFTSVNFLLEMARSSFTVKLKATSH